MSGLGLLLLLGACDWAFSTNTMTEDAKVDGQITAVRMNSDSGDVTIRAGEQAMVRRIVHYDEETPGPTHRLDGDVLVLDSCPVRGCWIDYEVTVPAGTTVDGAISSGSVRVDGLAAVNLKVSSGDVSMRSIAGKVNLIANSGNLELIDVGGPTVIESASGDVTVDRARAEVTVQANSGNITVRLAAPQSVRAQVDSGDVEVTVPRAAYQVSAGTDSGDARVDVTNDPAATHRLDVQADSGNITLAYS